MQNKKFLKRSKGIQIAKQRRINTVAQLEEEFTQQKQGSPSFNYGKLGGAWVEEMEALL